MAHDRDQQLAEAFSERYRTARTHLRHMMDALGMTEREGWRIGESVRQVSGGSEMVLRPLHRYLNAPPDMECVIWIDGGGQSVDMSCSS